jgi:hypothetical protein
MFFTMLGNAESRPHLWGKALPMGYPDTPTPDFGYCLECGDIIEYGHGRTDRKFCSAGCKNRWHNRRKALSWRIYENKILKTLEKNHFILERMLRIGLTSIDRMSLSRMGFDFNYVTSYHKLGQRSVFSVFDITYEATPSRVSRIACRRIGPEEEEEGAASEKEAKQPASAASADL